MRYAAPYSGFLLPFVLLASSALALDPTRPTQDYIRKTFTVEDGLQNNVVNAILQSRRDGFLWIGTGWYWIVGDAETLSPLRHAKSHRRRLQAISGERIFESGLVI